jgi:hypothetical protein
VVGDGIVVLSDCPAKETRGINIPLSLAAMSNIALASGALPVLLIAT